MIDEAEEILSLDELAGSIGLSRYHFHRLFKTQTGLTPKGYAAARRTRRMRDELIWEAMRQIPAGSTTSYAEIAARIGQPNSVRAVAQACGANVLAVAIPCHRVIRTDGSLSGYRWGVERKHQLLRREQGEI
jgi:O-6-methylguanine DNA methyltransferase